MVKQVSSTQRAVPRKHRALQLPVTGSRRAGFTLIELLLVCAIIAIVTAIVLANNNKYRGVTVLQSFAYDVALTIRQAQISGISVKESGCAGSRASFNGVYGVHFDISQPMQYTIFADCNGDGLFEAPPVDTIVATYTINRGYVLSALQATMNGTPTNADTLDIVFERPEPDARTSWSANGATYRCLADSRACASEADVTVKSPYGDVRTVSVTNNGQIVVQQM